MQDIVRNDANEGLQIKLRLCWWFRKTLESLGGSEATHEVMVGAVAERWRVTRPEVLRILTFIMEYIA